MGSIITIFKKNLFVIFYILLFFNFQRHSCPKCSENFSTKMNIIDHFQTEHKIKIEKIQFIVKTLDEFEAWKKNLEKVEKCDYIHESGKKSRENSQWQCHRSGYFTPVKKPKRRLAKKGSKKIDGFCPSSIHLIKNSTTGFYEVTFISTHVGHDNDLEHVRFDSEIREEIASKVAAGIPTDRIVKSCRSRNEDSSTQIKTKHHLVTRKDVYNVGFLNNVSNISVRNERRCPDDVEGVESYVTDEKNAESILFYKKQGDEHAIFKNEDFVLVIMKPEQEQKLKKFGSYVICLDGSHGTNMYDFLLHSLFIIDEYEEGYPACFMITNRNDEIVFNQMFSCIKNKVGLIITKVFLTDMQLSYINAWLNVMSNPKFILWCSWHVSHAWKTNYSKFTCSKKKRDELVDQLHDLRGETNKDKFHEKLDKFLSIADEGTQNFITYFKTYYASHPKNWAYAYRSHAGINTNMSIERFHGVVKHVYAKGLKIEQVQDILHILDDYIKEREEEAQIAAIKGKVSTKERYLRKAHDKAILLVGKGHVLNIQLNTFSVKSFTDDSLTYEVKKSEIKRCSDQKQCFIECLDCEVCLHEFYCSCKENSIRNRMCKHIHLVCLENDSFVHKKLDSYEFIKGVTEEGVVSPIYQEEILQHPAESSIKINIEQSKNLDSEADLDAYTSISVPKEVNDHQEDIIELSGSSSNPISAEHSKNLDSSKAELQKTFEGVLNLIETKNDSIYIKSMLSRMKATLSATKIGKGPSFKKATVKKHFKIGKCEQQLRGFRTTKKKSNKKKNSHQLKTTEQD